MYSSPVQRKSSFLLCRPTTVLITYKGDNIKGGNYVLKKKYPEVGPIFYFTAGT
jgi:hypothetical protein